jgi:hypothetical protein
VKLLAIVGFNALGSSLFGRFLDVAAGTSRRG